VDLRLPLLADINFHLDVAMEAASAGDWSTVRLNLDKAEASFEELRGVYPSLGAEEKGLMAALVAPLKARYEGLSKAVPPLTVISEGAPERDAEEDVEPEA
jgi:hypothetical protein